MTPPDATADPARDLVFDDGETLATAAALLGMGRGIDALVRPLTVVAFAGVLAPAVAPVALPTVSAWALAVAGLAGLVAAYYGVRVAFDAALFRRLADGHGDLATLDRALTALRLVPARNAGRPLGDRVRGATRLLRRQAALFALQAAALFVAGAAGHVSRS